MADLATVTTNIGTKVETIVASQARLTESDHLYDRERIPIGTTRYQIRGQYEVDDGRNSASPYKQVSIVVEWHHHLGAAESEPSYTAGEMVTIQSAVTAVAWWKSITGIREVKSGPDLVVDVERRGGSNILRYGVGVSFTLT